MMSLPVSGPMFFQGFSIWPHVSSRGVSVRRGGSLSGEGVSVRRAGSLSGGVSTERGHLLTETPPYWNVF